MVIYNQLIDSQNISVVVNALQCEIFKFILCDQQISQQRSKVLSKNCKQNLFVFLNVSQT